MNEHMIDWLLHQNIRNVTNEDMEEIQSLWKDFDISQIAQIIYFDGWSNYEEYAHLLVFLGHDDKIYQIESAHSVMISDVPSMLTAASVEDANEAINDMKQAITS